MTDWTKIAKLAYEAYVASMAADGIEVEETFDGMPEEEQRGLVAAARVAVDAALLADKPLVDDDPRI